MRVSFIEKEVEDMQRWMDPWWEGEMLVQEECVWGWRGWGSMDGCWREGVGGVGGSVTDSHLVPVARAALVGPLSAVASDGLSCLSPVFI